MNRGKKAKRRWSQTDILFPDSGKCLYSGGSTPQEASPDSHRQHSDMTCVNTPHCHSIPQNENTHASLDSGKSFAIVTHFHTM